MKNVAEQHYTVNGGGGGEGGGGENHGELYPTGGWGKIIMLPPPS